MRIMARQDLVALNPYSHCFLHGPRGIKYLYKKEMFSTLYRRGNQSLQRPETSLEVGTPQCWAADSGLNGPFCLPAMALLPACFFPSTSEQFLGTGTRTAHSHPFPAHPPEPGTARGDQTFIHNGCSSKCPGTCPWARRAQGWHFRSLWVPLEKSQDKVPRGEGRA